MKQLLTSLGFFESFWRARRRDRDLHNLNRAVAENEVEITIHDIGHKCWFSPTAADLAAE